MTPDEFTAKLEEFRAVVSEKLSELEESPKWGSPDEREQIVNALDELALQVDALSEALQEEPDEEDDGDGEEQ